MFINVMLVIIAVLLLVIAYALRSINDNIFSQNQRVKGENYAVISALGRSNSYLARILSEFKVYLHG